MFARVRTAGSRPHGVWAHFGRLEAVPTAFGWILDGWKPSPRRLGAFGAAGSRPHGVWAHFGRLEAVRTAFGWILDRWKPSARHLGGIKTAGSRPYVVDRTGRHRSQKIVLDCLSLLTIQKVKKYWGPGRSYASVFMPGTSPPHAPERQVVGYATV